MDDVLLNVLPKDPEDPAGFSGSEKPHCPYPAKLPLVVPDTVWLTFSLAFPDSTRLYRLIRQRRADVADAWSLIQRFLTRQDDELAAALEGELDQAQLAALFSPATQRQRDRALQWQEASPLHHLLGLDHPAYPALLRDTEDAPTLLYARGELDALRHPLLAVVGSRKASHGALALTRTLCTELADHGVGIVSGLALGIDATAHEGALQAGAQGHGPTIAIAATPPDRVYPKRHADLAERIVADGGLVISEYPLGSLTRPWYFPRRNRIISGVSLGVLVMEAGLPSGTLTTATHAMNQGREVMAIPGSVMHPQARGCHALIKQGAALVENSLDVLETLGQPLCRALAVLREHQALGHSRAVPGASVEARQSALDFDAPDQRLYQRLGERLGERLDQHPDQCKDGPNQRDVRQPDLSHPELSRPEQQLMHRITAAPATFDDLLACSKSSVSYLATQLGRLEINGVITITSGGRYTRC